MQSTRFEMRIPPDERVRLRELAATAGKSQGAVVRDLVRAAAARRQASPSYPFGRTVDEHPPDAAA